MPDNSKVVCNISFYKSKLCDMTGRFADSSFYIHTERAIRIVNFDQIDFSMILQSYYPNFRGIYRVTVADNIGYNSLNVF